MSALPLLEDVRSIPARTLLPGRRSYGLIRQSRLALLAFGSSPRTRSLRRLLPAPAANRDLPDVISANHSSDAWSLTTAVPRSAYTCFFLRVIGLPHEMSGSASRYCPRIRLLAGSNFRRCRHSFMFRPPSLLVPQVVPTAAHVPQGSRDFYIRAERASLPLHAPDMLAVRIQVIDGARTFTLQDPQPCRLLPGHVLQKADIFTC